MKILKNQQGQSIVEAVLLMVVLVGVATLVTTQLKENEVASKLVSTPWEKLDNMIRYGTWEVDRDAALSNHPNQNRKHSTPTP